MDSALKIDDHFFATLKPRCVVFVRELDFDVFLKHGGKGRALGSEDTHMSF